MLKRWMTGVAAAVIVMAIQIPASALGLGDPAPNMAVKAFVKGTPVTAFQKGKIYVVEFWATWCGPCRTSIPRLTELAKTHKDTTFVGISVWETDQSKVKPFVAQMGDKMDYHVAMDTVPAGAKGDAGTMAKTWMAAAAQDGIPTAFIVDKTSRIAWIGHPMAMEGPLDKIEAGTWDMAAAKVLMDHEQAVQKKIDGIYLKMRQAGTAPDKQLAVVNNALTADPNMESMLGHMKMSLLLEAQPDAETTVAYAEHLTDSVYKDAAEILNNIAWSLVDTDQPKRSAKLYAVALKAAQRADGLTQGKDAGTADTLARAYFCTGNAAQALETQQRAVALAKGTPLEHDTNIAARLAEYQKAATK